MENLNLISYPEFLMRSAIRSIESFCRVYDIDEEDAGLAYANKTYKTAISYRYEITTRENLEWFADWSGAEKIEDADVDEDIGGWSESIYAIEKKVTADLRASAKRYLATFTLEDAKAVPR